MAWSLLQSNSSDVNTVASTALAFASNISANSLIIVMGRWGALTGTITATDTLGNTYVHVTSSPVGDGVGDDAFMLWAFSASGGANTVTLTVTGGGSHRITLCIVEFATGGTGVTVDIANGGTGAVAAGATTPSVTTSGGSDLVVSNCNVATAQAAGQMLVNSPLTAVENASNNGYAGTFRGMGGYQLNVTAGTYSPNYSWTTSASWSTNIAAFIATGGGGIGFDEETWSAQAPPPVDPIVSVW